MEGDLLSSTSSNHDSLTVENLIETGKRNGFGVEFPSQLGHRPEESLVSLLMFKRQTDPYGGTSTILPARFAQIGAKLPPLARKVLVDGVTLEPGLARDLLESLSLPQETKEAALSCLEDDSVQIQQACVLLPESCAVLRGHCDKHLSSGPDSVDGAPTFQVQLNLLQVEKLLGLKASQELRTCSENLLRALEPANGTAKFPLLGDIFLRRYTSTTRPFIPFHCDHAAFTVNIALGGRENGSGGEEGGGHLVALHRNSIVTLLRNEGEATAHTSALLHGVSRITSGERHTMIMFFNKV